jgi:hypothetical protein
MCAITPGSTAYHRAWRIAHSEKIKGNRERQKTLYALRHAESRKKSPTPSFKEYCVYALCHPETTKVFYIGTTKSRYRLTYHVIEARNFKGLNTNKNATILYQLLALGKKPIFKVLHDGLSKRGTRDNLGALEIESDLILEFVTQRQHTGHLVNWYCVEYKPEREEDPWFFLNS